jgi:hypothetical protein
MMLGLPAFGGVTVSTFIREAALARAAYAAGQRGGDLLALFSSAEAP